MIALRAAFGGVAGLALGWLVWLAARRFAARYRRQDQASASAVDGAFQPRAAAPILLMTLWGAIVGWQADSLAVAGLALVVTGLLLCITLVDLRVRRIPNPLVLSLLACAVAQVLWLGQPDWGAAALGLAVAGGLFFLLAFIKRDALGMGDVKLEAAAGALLGYPAALAAVAAGVVAGGLAALFLLLTRRAGRKDTFAYGPYLALGAWLVLVQMWGLWPGQ
jgi:leader peptidase (prepilin peptidase)/N-methyltransferase